MTLDLRRLRHLLALAEHGSFGRAAAALRMTQPALSRSIKLLEEQIGAALFERSVTGVTPTDEGRLLVQRAGELVRAADELDREVLRRRVAGVGQLVVGAGPYPGETIVPVALARFVAAHPLVRVRILIAGDWDDLLRRLRARELDLVVAETSTLGGEHDLEIERLTPHPVYFVARRDHPLAHRSVVRAEDTFAYPFLGLSRFPPRALRPMLAMRPEPGARRRGRPFPALELTSLAAVKRVLANSDAIAPLTLPCVAEEVGRGTLVLLMTEPWLSTAYGLVRLKGHAPSAAATNFSECLRDAEGALVREESRLVARHSHRGAAASARRRRRS
ncbi:MAG: LysR family transcriptional regulator [Burkholderiales bacterium]|nr:LysR family transcriptional regulator [Burkholderiales bacterium]